MARPKGELILDDRFVSPKDCKCQMYLTCHLCCGTGTNGCSDPAKHMQSGNWDYTVNEFCEEHSKSDTTYVHYVTGKKRKELGMAFRMIIDRRGALSHGMKAAISKEQIFVEPIGTYVYGDNVVKRMP